MRQVNVLLGLALFALPIPASADTITLTSSATSVHADATVFPTVATGVPVENQPNLTTSTKLFYYPADVATTAFRFAGGDTGRVSTSGALVPGRYSFFVNSASSSFAIGDRSTTADFNFTLQVGQPVAAPTPEPATLVLLMTGVAGVVSRQRLRGHR